MQVTSSRPGRWSATLGPIPRRRRVIVVGATEAGISAAFHLGEHAMVVEQRGATRATGVTLWDPPRLGSGQMAGANDSWDAVWNSLLTVMKGEVRLGIRATAIHVTERRLEVSTGESYVYDKLVVALPMKSLQRLVAGETPSRLTSDEAWRHWLNARDIEPLDAATQLSFGDLDGEAAGRRVADNVRIAMALKYSTRAVFKNRGTALFQPRIVGSVSAP